jgi:hypothetical protein
MDRRRFRDAAVPNLDPISERRQACPPNAGKMCASISLR